MYFSCLLFPLPRRRSVPFLIPTIALYPRQLLFYDPRPPRTHLKSTLLQVFILENLKPFGINTYEKQGRGYRLWLTDCSKVVSSSILRTHFQVPYPAIPLFVTLTKTAGVCGDSSQFGTVSPGSLRERFCVNPRHQLQRILVVDLLQHLVRHLESVNSPECVALAVILKILVARFQRPEIPFVFVHLVDVFAHQHAILVFHQKVVRRIRLAPQFRQHRGDVHVHIGTRIKEPSQPPQAISFKAEMRADKTRLPLLPNPMIPLRHHPFTP